MKTPGRRVELRFMGRTGRDLAEMVPGAGEATVALLKRLLTYDAVERISAEEALKMECFAPIWEAEERWKVEGGDIPFPAFFCRGKTGLFEAQEEPEVTLDVSPTSDSPVSPRQEEIRVRGSIPRDVLSPTEVEMEESEFEIQPLQLLLTDEPDRALSSERETPKPGSPRCGSLKHESQRDPVVEGPEEDGSGAAPSGQLLERLIRPLRPLRPAVPHPAPVVAFPPGRRARPEILHPRISRPLADLKL
jgi:hypothetical protein